MTTRVGSATGSNTATMPTHAVGDLIVAFAFRDGSTTAPTTPSEGWIPLAVSSSAVAAVGTSCSAVMVAKIADSTSENVGTFTNATFVGVVVYRGGSGKKVGIGTWAFQVGTATSVTYPATTLIGASSTSWAGAFAGHRSTNTNLQNAPTNMSNVASYVDATDEGAIHDTNGPVASWSSTAVAVGGTASGWIAASFEVREYTTALARYEAARDHPTDNALVIGIGHSHMAAAGAVTNNSFDGDAIKFGYLQQVADVFTACVARSSDASFMGDQNVTANGFSPANYNQNLTLSSWAAYAPVSTLGAKAFTPSSASTLSWDPDVAFDRVQVFYPRVNGVPEYTVNVDGGSSLGTLNMNDTTEVFASETFSVSDATHQLRFVAGSTGGLIAGALVWRSTVKQLTFLNCSWAGALVTDYLNASTVWSPYNAIQTFGNVAATIIHLDKNEELSGVALEAFRYNLASLVLARLFFGDVILISSVLTDPTTYSEATQTTYHDAVAAWATLMGCGYVSGSAQPGFSTYATANGLGYFNTDGIHLFAAGGQIAYADPLLALLDASSVSLTVNNAAHAHASTSPTLAAKSTVSANNASHAHAATSPTLAAKSTVSADNATHAHSATEPTLAAASSVTPDDAAHAHAATSPSLSSALSVAPDNASHAHAATSPTLAAQSSVSVNDAAHTHTAGSPSLAAASTVAVDSAAHAHTSGSPSLAFVPSVAVDSAAHAHSAGSPTLAAKSTVTPANASHGHTASQPSLAAKSTVSVDSAAHAHAATQPTLAAKSTVAVNGASHAHTATEPTLVNPNALVVQNAAHAHTADSPALAFIPRLVVDNTAHGHTASSPTLRPRSPTGWSAVVQVAETWTAADETDETWTPLGVTPETWEAA